MIDFVDEKHKQLYDLIRKMSEQLYGSGVIFDGQKKLEFCLWKGSTLVHIGVLPFPVMKDVYFLHAWAVVSYDAKYSSELAKELITKNNNIYFGHFTFFEHKDKLGAGNIVFEYMIPANNIQNEQLDIAIYNVAYYSDLYDEEFSQKFGGVTALDASRKNVVDK